MDVREQAVEKVVADMRRCDPLRKGRGIAMRRDDEIWGSLFSYIDLEDRVRVDHPLRPIHGKRSLGATFAVG